MATGQAISAALNEFRLEWQKSSRNFSADELTQDSIDQLLELAKTLIRKTDNLVEAETLQWVKEFRETLAEVERSAEAKASDNGLIWKCISRQPQIARDQQTITKPARLRAGGHARAAGLEDL